VRARELEMQTTASSVVGSRAPCSSALAAGRVPWACFAASFFAFFSRCGRLKPAL
jgi:hypothetical protein